MRSINRLFLVIGLFAVTAVSAFSQSPTGFGDISAQVSSVTEFDVNGLKVLVKRRPSAPTVAGGLFIRGGSRNLTEKDQGIENLMLRTAVEAGTKYDRTAIRRELAETGSAVGAGVAMDYSVVSLASTRENFDKVWDIFTDVIMRPKLAKEDVDRVRTQLISGLREAETSPDSALLSLEERAVYKGHPYANDSSGTIATLSGMTPAELAAYHKKIMQTSQLLLVIVGDIDPQLMKQYVTNSLGKLPRGTYKTAPMPPLDFSKPTLDILPRKIGTNYVKGVFAAPSLNDPDYYAMRVAINILQQLVYSEVRQKRQLSYAPNAEMNNFAANTANIYVTAVDANQSVSVMLDQIKMLQERTLTDEMIDGLAGQFLTQYYLDQETSGAQAAELARYELIGGGWRNAFQFLERVRKVTAADVKNVSKKYMKNLRFVVVGDTEAIDRKIFLQEK
jgi:predicted Zn-dependent peptidase